MKYLLIILLSLFGLSASAQLMQTNGTAGGYQFVGLKIDSLHIIPRGTDTPNIGGTKYGKSTVGAMFYKTADSTLWIRSANKWNQVTGTGGGTSGITSLGQGYGVIIANDSTYNVDSSLFISVQHFYNTIDSVINTISSSGIDSIVVNSPLAIDFTNRQIPVISYTGDTTRYFVFESPIQADDHGDTVYVSFDSTGNGDYSIAHHSFGYYLGVFLTRAQADQYYISYDSALGKFVDTGYSRTDSFFLVKNGVEFLQGVIPASAAGGISEVVADWGLINVNDSTLKADSFLVASRARVGKVADSLGVLINLRVKYSDTASMLSPYVRRVLAGTNVTVDNSNPQYPIVSATAGGTGTVTSVATNNGTGITGGTITTTGTLAIDTAWVIATKAALGKTRDSLGVIIATKEPALGNPASNGYVLSSTTSGTRSWIAASGGSSSTSVTEKKNYYNQEFIAGASINTSTGAITRTGSDNMSDYIAVEGSTAIDIFPTNGYGNITVYGWFYDTSLTAISEIRSNALINTKTGYYSVTTPSNARYINLYTKYAGQDFARALNIKSASTITYNVPITPEQFTGSKSVPIQSAIDYARFKSAPVELNGYYTIDSSLILYSGSTLILKNATLKLDSLSRNNIIRNEAVRKKDSIFARGNKYINIIGVGKSTIEGSNAAWSFYQNNTDATNMWKVIGLYFANVSNFRVEGLTFRNTNGWAASFEQSRIGLINDITFRQDSAHPNQDGINLRYGTHNVTIQNVKGFTWDDMVALTNIKYDSAKFQILNTTIYEPYRTNLDIDNIVIRNVNRDTTGLFTGFTEFYKSGMLLLCEDGLKIHDVSIDGVEGPQQIQLGFTGIDYHTLSQATVNDMYNISVSNAYSNINIDRPIKQSSFVNVSSLSRAGSANVVFQNGSKNLTRKYFDKHNEYWDTVFTSNPSMVVTDRLKSESGTAYMAIGNGIGINTTSPNAATILDVSSTTKASRPLPTMTAAQQNAVSSPPAGALVYNSDSSGVTFYNGSAWRMLGYNAGTNSSISATDSVAIKKIPANDFPAVYHYIGFNSGAGGLGQIGGAVGVSTNPGNIFFGKDAGYSVETNNTSTGNVFIGATAGKWSTRGSYHFALGASTLGGANTTLADSLYATSFQQLAIGYTALSKLKGNPGPQTAIGVGALINATTPTAKNTAIGPQSLSAITTGTENIDVGGYNSGGATMTNTVTMGGTSTGSNSTAIGKASATGSNSTATAIGASSTAGVNSTAIGYNANAGGNTSFAWGTNVGDATAANMIAIGSAAHLSNTSNDNIGIGRGALAWASATAGGTKNMVLWGGNNTTRQNRWGSNNTIIGWMAGNADTTGSVVTKGMTGNNLVLIGASAGSNQRSGNYGIAIGTVDFASTTGDNQLSIGNNSVNWITKFTGNQFLINASGSAVTSASTGAALEVKSTTGGFMPPIMTGAQATTYEGTTPADGNIIYVSSTNGTFTSVGFWGKISGTWTALHL